MQLGGGGFYMYRPNFFYVVLFGLLIAGLFFIPEITEFAGISSDSTGGSKLAARELPIEEEPAAPVAQTSRARLDSTKFVRELELKDEVVAEPEPLRAGDESLSDSPDRVAESPLGRFYQSLYQGETDAPVAGEAKVEQVAIQTATRPIGPTDLTWSQLLAKESASSLKTARDGYMRLAREIGEEYPQSRGAVVNLANGLGFVVSSADKFMSVESAVRYVRDLNHGVEEAFRNENMDRMQYVKWREAGQGRLFDLIGMAEQIRIPSFNPDFQLQYVKISPKIVRGRPDLRQPARLEIEGVARADGIVRAEIYQDGRRLRELKFNKKGRVPTSGLRIKTKVRDAAGQFTIQFYDLTGKSYSKSYRFLPMAQRFGVDLARGEYVVPYPANARDKRLDRLFLVKVQGSDYHSLAPSAGNLFAGGGSRSFVSF